jgi:hypothetical protein
MSSFLSSLNSEWIRLAKAPPARRAVIRWSRRFRVFVGLRDPLDLLERRSADPAQAAEMLAALASLAPSDELAARTLLHALLPGLIRLSRTTGHDDYGAVEELVALAWERIRTYPSDRRGRVAANILLDVRKRYRADRRIDAPQSIPVPAWAEATVPSAETEALQRLTLCSVVEAYRRGAIDPAAYELIVRTRFVGISLGEIAREQQVRVQVLAMRRRRAEQRLLNGLQAAC